MKKELLNQELEMVNGGYSLVEAITDEIYGEMSAVARLVQVKKYVDKEKNDPIHAYDMIEYNKR